MISGGRVASLRAGTAGRLHRAQPRRRCGLRRGRGGAGRPLPHRLRSTSTSDRGRRPPAPPRWPRRRRSPGHRQRPGEIPALWQRIADERGAGRPAGLGWPGDSPVPDPSAVATGQRCGGRRLGLRPQKVVLGPVFGAAVGRALAAVDARRAGGRGGQRHGARLPGRVGAGVPRRPGEPAGRAGRAGGPALRRAAGGPHPLRRHRLRAGAGRGAGRHLRAATPPTSASSPRSTSWPGPSSTRRPSTRGCGEFYEHTTRFTPRHRPRVAALGAARATCSTARWSPGRSARPTCR